MSDPASQLRAVLYQLTIGLPDDPSGGYHEDSSRLDALTDIVRGFGMGEYDITFLQEVFRNAGPKNFDITAWVQQKVIEGVYHEDALLPDPEEEPEVLPENVIPLY